RVAALVQRGTARVVERQAEAEADPGFDLACALAHLLGGDQVDATELVVVAPVAPRRTGRALRPPLGHCSPSSLRFWVPKRARSARFGTQNGLVRRRCTVPTGWLSLRDRFAQNANGVSAPGEVTA